MDKIGGDDPMTVFEAERGQEILAALRAHDPDRAAQLTEHLVLESYSRTTGDRQGPAMLAAAAYVAQMDAAAAGDREYDYQAAVAPWCTPTELHEGAMLVLYSQGSTKGWLPAPLHDIAKQYFDSVGSRYAGRFADIERRDV